MAEQISYSGTAGFDYDGFDNWKLSDYPEGLCLPEPWHFGQLLHRWLALHASDLG